MGFAKLRDRFDPARPAAPFAGVRHPIYSKDDLTFFSETPANRVTVKINWRCLCPLAGLVCEYMARFRFSVTPAFWPKIHPPGDGGNSCIEHLGPCLLAFPKFLTGQSRCLWIVPKNFQWIF